MEVEVRKCQGAHTAITRSKYPKDKVPVYLFRKDPEDPDSKVYKSCFDCRRETARRGNKSYNKKVNRVKKEKEELLEAGITELPCSHSGHGTTVESAYDVNEVPIKFFRRDPEDPKSDLFDKCIDCRRHLRGTHEKFRLRSIEEAERRGLFWCSACGSNVTEDYRGLNLDGSPSSLCVKCKALKPINNAKPNIFYNQLKLQLILDSKMSCEVCECLYFKPDGESLVIAKIHTVQRAGISYALFGTDFVPVDVLLRNCSDELEIRVVELDHLTEEEQRERGLLLAHEPFVPKKDSVSQMHGIVSVKREAMKCRHLCAKCHIKETMKREIAPKQRGTARKQEKELYVKALKKLGCSACGENEVLPRFYEMDHLDPRSKVADLAFMVTEEKYSLEDVKFECKKCRVLCRHCHIIHTSNQRKSAKLSSNSSN